MSTKPSKQNTKTSPKPVAKTAAQKSSSKQASVIKLLSRPAGTTIAKIIDATGWQAHSVRGFLAGVIRKKLKLPLTSETVGENRIYRITQKTAAKA